MNVLLKKAIKSVKKQQQVRSELENIFWLQIKQLDIPPFVEQYKEAIPGRRFIFDFAWPNYQLLVEINGGTYVRMGHSTGSGISRDYEKNNLAMFYGWKPFSFDCKMVRSGNAALFLKSYFQSIGVMK